MLITLLVAVVVAAIIYWIMTLLPIPQPFKNIIIVVLALIFVIWLLQATGVFSGDSLNFRRR